MDMFLLIRTKYGPVTSLKYLITNRATCKCSYTGIQIHTKGRPKYYVNTKKKLLKTFSSSSLVLLRLGFELGSTTSAFQRIIQVPQWNFMNTSQERGNIYSDGLRVTGNSQAQAAGESTEPSCGRPGLPSPSPPGPGQPEAARCHCRASAGLLSS
jgi:hypothetical protein